MSESDQSTPSDAQPEGPESGNLDIGPDEAAAAALGGETALPTTTDAEMTIQTPDDLGGTAGEGGAG
jgi:hypothetical protein